MKPFVIVRPRSFHDASREMRDRSRTSLPIIKAGGMDVVDHLKEGLLAPDALIDVRPLGGDAIPGGGIDVQNTQNGWRLRISANATLAQLGSHAGTREHFGAVAQSAASAATPQVRNVATVAGNLLQRPRCWYYRHQQFHCLKKGGGNCFALEGENQYHAIFGNGPCHIVHPSNLAVAMSIFDASLHWVGSEEGSGGDLRMAELYHLPRQDVLSEYTLPENAVVTAVSLSGASKMRSAFYSIKEKQSFDWPLVCVAAAVELDGPLIQSARICAGAVAPVPWRLPRVEEALRGVNLDDEAALKAACDIASEGATPLSRNRYKVRLVPVAVRRAVFKAAGRPVEDES